MHARQHTGHALRHNTVHMHTSNTREVMILVLCLTRWLSRACAQSMLQDSYQIGDQCLYAFLAHMSHALSLKHALLAGWQLMRNE